MGEVKGNKGKKLPLTKNQLGARFALAGCIILLIALIIVLFMAIVAMANGTSMDAMIAQASEFSKVNYAEGEQLVPVKDAGGDWCFTTDREFKIMQLTDVHIGGGSFSTKNDAWAMNAVAAMISAEKPDLVVVTGDIAYPVPFSAGTFNNLSATKIFAELMEKLGVYWIFTYGNHDTEVYSYYTREDINNYYEESNFKYCLYQRGDENISGFGNSVIKVKNTAGVVTQALVMLDSHSYTDGDSMGILWKYDNIHQDQIDWYAKEMDEINEYNKTIDANAEPVKNLAFFHIPLPEYRDAWGEYVENDNKDTENVTFVYGVMGESMKENSSGQQTYGVYCGIGRDKFFETGKEKGLQGVFCGHDHYNNFSVIYKGIRLTYGMSVDYLAYAGIWNEKSQRGCTLITVETDGSFNCESSGYYQDKYVAQFEKH